MCACLSCSTSKASVGTDTKCNRRAVPLVFVCGQLQRSLAAATSPSLQRFRWLSSSLQPSSVVTHGTSKSLDETVYLFHLLVVVSALCALGTLACNSDVLVRRKPRPPNHSGSSSPGGHRLGRRKKKRRTKRIAFSRFRLAATQPKR